MATKAQVKKRDEKILFSNAEYGHFLATLLWRKLMVNLTPEIQETLLVWKDLDNAWDQLAPDDFHRVPKMELTLDNLQEEINKAEYLLTGGNFPRETGLPHGYQHVKMDYEPEQSDADS
jgi:hypothetical protein